MLVFLLPLIVAYEVGLMMLHHRLGNVAHLTLLRFFQSFDLAPLVQLYLGGVAIVVVLLTWHILSGHRWRLNWSVVGIMALESAALAMPLVLLSQFIASIGVTAAATSGPMSVPDTLLETLVISLGAGLYEELLFRMLLIGILHTLLVDVAGASNTVGCVIAIIVSAAAFAWYHTVGATTALPARQLIFLFLAGLYFGTLFLTRGFGIVVGVHAVYDVVILMYHSG